MQILKFLMLTVVAALLVACGGGGGGGDKSPGAPPVVAKITLSPPAPVLTVGESTQLTAIPTDSSGRPVSGRTVTWSSQAPTVATVTAVGRVTAIGVGSAPIVASVDGHRETLTVTVVLPPPQPVASVEVSPASAVIDEGATHPFFAVARDASGQPVGGRGIQWTVADAGIAHVDPAGVVTALRPGVTTVTARVDGKTASAGVRVQADHAFGLLYDRSSAGNGVDLYTLDINDPAAVPTPVFPGAQGRRDSAASPDGQRIAYVVVAGSETVIFAADRNGGNVVQLTQPGSNADQPAWSPDGSRIAFRRRFAGAGSDIWVMDAADGANAVNLTASHGAASQGSPAWSPRLGDGSMRIAYNHSEGGNGHIWTMRDDGTDRQQVTGSSTAYDDQPAWSPDGARIVFMRSDAAVFGDLYVVSAGGGSGGLLMQLAGPLAGPQLDPAWSPDGRLVAFASRHAGDHYQIYTVWSDGTRLAQRTFDAADHAGPAWLGRIVTP